MSIAGSYRKYRKVGAALTEKIMNACVSRETIKASAKFLNVLKGNDLLLTTEEVGIAFIDFVLNDYQTNGKNAIEAYRENPGEITQDERTLLDAWASSYTSLFKITKVSSAEHTLVLSDRLNQTEDVKLLDFSLSESTISGMLIFARIVPFEEFNMTSGNLFIFYESQEPQLLQKYKYQTKKVKSDHEPIKRFVTFFHLNRTYGVEVGYQ